jgi:hypothetical protein
MKPFNEHDPVTIKEMEIGAYALHGDVIITRVAALPENFNKMEKEPKNALAYGEFTGHVHQLTGEATAFDLRIDPVTPAKRHLTLLQPVALKHQEHRPIILPPGQYEIGVQREYDPFTKKIRAVQD